MEHLLFVQLVQAQELLSWTCSACPISVFRQDGCSLRGHSRASGGMYMGGGSVDLPLDPSPAAEMGLKLSLAVTLGCVDVETRALGLALPQPVAWGVR